MRWPRLVDVRDARVRLVLLDLSGLGYLLLIRETGAAPTGLQWLLAIVAFAAVLPLHKRPVTGFAVQVALFGAALLLVDDQTVNRVGAAWALFEVTIRAGRTVRWWSAGLLGAVALAHALPGPLAQLSARLFGVALLVGLPLLAGTVIRINAELSRQAAERAAERAAEEQRRRESEARAARADERNTIARELHDVLAHQVASMVLRVGVARHVIPGLDPQVRQVFDDVHSTGTTALTDLRRLVAVLRGPGGVRDDAALTAIEPAAVPAALDGAVENARRAGLVVDADIAAETGTLDAVRGQAVLRLTQEALTNVVRHAGAAARVRLLVAVTDGDVTWEVADDGGGPAPADPAVRHGGGHGLTGMRERVSVLGGSLEAGPHDGGWRVRTVLPRVAS